MMKINKIIFSLFTIFSLILIQPVLIAQGIVDEEDIFEINYDSPLTIDLEAEEEIEIRTVKKKKVKKNTFYGIRTRKGFTKSRFGNKTVVELFYYLRKYEEVDQYVRDIYWYNFSKKKIIKSRKINKDNAVILHGPYKKMLGDKILEEGIFYKGTKHGRWSKWNRHDILQSKEKYYKGWPKESKVVYYDKNKKQIKEIIPIHFGEKEGNYYAFYDTGNVAVRGEYHFDSKIGVWREYFNIRNRRKREVQYSKDPFDKSFRPYVLREWNNRGKLIYDASKRKKSNLYFNKNKKISN